MQAAALHIAAVCSDISVDEIVISLSLSFRIRYNVKHLIRHCAVFSLPIAIQLFAIRQLLKHRHVYMCTPRLSVA